MKIISSVVKVKSLLLNSYDNVGIKHSVESNDKEFIQLYLDDFCNKYLKNIFELLDKKENSNKSHSLLNNPNIYLISNILEKNIFDIGCYIDEYSNYYCDLILEFNNNSNIFYIRWVDKIEEISTFDDLNNCIDSELRKKIFTNISKLLNKFCNCEIFYSLIECYDYLKKNCIFRNNSNVKYNLRLNNFTLEDAIIHFIDLSIIEILELMDIRFSNLEKLGKLINYLEKTLPNKKRIKSNHYSKTKLNFVKYTWDELGSIKLLVNKWCKDNK